MKHPVQKRKASSTRTKRRYAIYVGKQLKKISSKYNTAICPNCKERKLDHFICPNCGHYRSKQVVNIKGKKRATIKA